MNLPRLAIERPVAITMAILAVVGLGVVSLLRLPLDLLPALEFPVAVVVTDYEGAGPREVENLITKPIEEGLASVGRLRKLTSTSRRGESMVLAEFEWGTDMDFATLEMRERIDMVRAALPDDAETPRIFKFDPNQFPIMAITVGGDRSPAELRRLAEDVIKPRLERLDGVASVGIGGGLEREIQVRVHPGQLEAYRIPLDQVVQVLRSENRNLPGGSVVEGGKEHLLHTTGEFTSLEELANLPLSTPSGQRVALRQIATIHDTYKDVDLITRLNGKPSVGVSVQKESEANTVQVARRVRDELERLKRDLGPDIDTAVVLDSADFIERSIREVEQNALTGSVLAALVLLLFLGSLRTTLVIALSIPICVIGTFVLVYFAGMSLNIISLGGLALGVGMLVDNAIVVLENIFRHRSLGASAKEAADVGANEVGMAIAASTLTTVAVFLPVVFVEGIASQIFRDLSLTVSFSVGASLVVALTLVPLLASRFLRGPGLGEGGPPEPVKGVKAVFPRMIVALQERYARLLHWSLGHRRWVLTLVLGAFVGSLALLPRLGTEFLPDTDQGIVRLRVETPVGTPLEQTDRVVRWLEAKVGALPEVEAVYARVGSAGPGSGMFGGGGTGDRATVDLRLVPRDQRSRSAREVAEEIRRLVREVPGASIFVTTQTMGGGLLGGAPIDIELRGDDEARLMALADQIADRVRRVPGTREVETSVADQRPEYQLVVRRERAAELGLTVPQLAAVEETAVDGQVATRYRTGGDEIDVRVRLDDPWRSDRRILERIPVSSPRAGLVPLGEVVRFVPAQAPRDLERSEQARIIHVTGQIVGRDLGSVTRDIQATLAGLAIPPDIQVSFGGQREQMAEAFGQLALALGVAVFLVYAVMAAQFESLVQPFIIMVSIPLALIGVILGLLGTGRAFGVPAFIGLIMLAGIVVNNAIVLIDYVNRLRRQGMARGEALVQAGRTRLRPILMTASTTVLGMLPLALGIGEGSEFQAPLATVVAFGLSFSTVLTLVVVPLLYAWVEDFSAAVVALFGLSRRPRAAEEVKVAHQP